MHIVSDSFLPHMHAQRVRARSIFTLSMAACCSICAMSAYVQGTSILPQGIGYFGKCA